MLPKFGMYVVLRVAAACIESAFGELTVLVGTKYILSLKGHRRGQSICSWLVVVLCVAANQSEVDALHAVVMAAHGINKRRAGGSNALRLEQSYCKSIGHDLHMVLTNMLLLPRSCG